ncbi:hypothetical protein BpHYR1_039467 [Brachionus plicatilis]|uniref:Uncharacterized protein n=1 Tax=Brachionus plicatilis TaxID=10195 RepID=A0A3M7P9S6_BRAPC|nr:hypothetical protein BpHYR1_039467 [Brachionus plicatilis]
MLQEVASDTPITKLVNTVESVTSTILVAQSTTETAEIYLNKEAEVMQEKPFQLNKTILYEKIY